jgi:hypothetical protein
MNRLLLMIIILTIIGSTFILVSTHNVYADLVPQGPCDISCRDSYQKAKIQENCARFNTYTYSCQSSFSQKFDYIVKKNLSNNGILFTINFVVETLVALIFLYKKKYPRKRVILLAVLVVNLLSWPLLYLFTRHFTSQGYLVGGEVMILFTEAVGIFLIAKRDITKKSALILSTLTNLSTILLSIIFTMLR